MNGDAATGELGGTAAIVTGSAKNIGRATALALAEAGAAVLINARTSMVEAEAVKSDIEAAGGRAIVHMADVTREDQVQGMVDAAVAAFGRLDILVNNVGSRSQTPIVETSLEDWHAVLSSALDSSFLCTRASVPHLAKGGRGAIVNVGGVSGHAGVANRSPVATAKAGLAGLTGALAIELAPQNIRVNCVSPGHINTTNEDGVPQHFIDRVAPHGVGDMDEIAAVIRFLCTPGARFITGETIHANGGWYVSIA
jgi:3-oxoacyl-[acyl-carrier protein] reductase